MKYNLVVAGGTFDLLHKGHKNFINQILSLSENAVIGVTSDIYVEKFKNQNIEDFKTRKNKLEQYLAEIKVTERIEIQKTEDIYGPLLDKDFAVDAIVVTKETQRGAELVNKARKKMKLPLLKIIEVEMEKAEDGGIISSTRIRNGEIDRSGRLYFNRSWENKIFILPHNLRNELHKPFGKLLKKLPEAIINDQTITIGDVTSSDFNKKNFKQLISIIDFKVQRHIKFSKIEELGFSNKIKTISIENKPATINSSLFINLKNTIKSKNQSLLLINGEEDLVFIPAVLVSPLGFTVYYGQPSEGLVEVKVTEENKEKIFELINKFEIKSFDKYS